MSRRTLFRGAGIAAAGAGLSACGSSLAAGITGTGPARDSLVYWNLFSGGDGVRMVSMTDAYKKSHPDVALESTTLAWGNPYYTKLSLATLGDRPPDVAVAHVSRATTLAKAGLLEPFDTGELARHGMTPDKFTPAAWKAGQVDGRLYTIPLDTHPFVLYYNVDVCRKAGLLKADGTLKDLDGPDGFTDALAAVKKVTGEFGGVVNINADPSTCWRWFASLYAQAGGQVLANQGRDIVLDPDRAEAVLAYMRTLTVEKKLMPSNIDGNGVTTLFNNSQVGLLLDGEWNITTYLGTEAADPKFHFNMTRIPHVFAGTYACFADSHTLVLPKNGKRTDGRRALSLEFIRSLLQSSYNWAEGGHVPAWLPVQDSEKYQKLQPQSNYVAAAKSAVYDPEAWYSGAGSVFETLVGSVVAVVEGGQISPQQGVAQMRRKLKTYATTKPPVK